MIQSKSQADRLTAWGIEHIDIIFRILRNVWPIPSFGKFAMVTRADDVREVMPLSEVFVRREDIELRLKVATLDVAERIVSQSGGELEIVDFVRSITFEVLCDNFGTPSPATEDLRVWATRLFEFQFADHSYGKAIGDVGSNRQWISHSVRCRNDDFGFKAYCRAC
jgi:hypothetical protein